MCGIFAVYGDKKGRAAKSVLSGLKKLEYRGYDSWGIALRPDDGKQLLVEKHVGKIGEAQTSLPEGKMAIGHTRWATHGGVTDGNAHPHLDCTKQLAVIHNGIVENYQDLKSKLLKKGHRFDSETDTEIIAHLVEEHTKTMTIEKAVFSAFAQLAGSNAVCVIDAKTESIVAARNGSPLAAGFIAGETFLASDTTAFLDKTNRVHFLQDNEGITISAKRVRLYRLPGMEEIKMQPVTLDWKAQDADKGGYPHFLIKEIMEQARTIPQAFRINATAKQSLKKMLEEGYRPVFIGCGTASYCGLAGQYRFARAGIESMNVGGYEFEPFAGSIGPKTLVFAVSQSGETADTLIAVKEAKKRQAHIVAVVNARGSTLERLADTVLPVSAGPEIAVVSTKAFTGQLASLYSLFGQPEMLDLEAWLNTKLQHDILEMARNIMNEEHAFVIGKYHNYPAALEFALKLKETSYIHAEAFAAGELKHGVITLVQKGTPCFILADSGAAFREIRSSAAQLKARGGYIIGVGPQEAPEFDAWIATPDRGEEYSIFYNVIVGQLLGYYLGVGRGADPDKPRNLAKSVTVK